ncbi:amidohydrolase family protein [Streptomyces nigra]|uniref:amidohydrolase family protein n=1 Tax=Streptomyces nigra TaxID=1827580 RepID=UPI0036C04D89
MGRAPGSGPLRVGGRRGAVPASRPALTIANDTARSPSTYWTTSAPSTSTTALSSSPAALPTLLAVARPGHVLFRSDWPFAPTPAGQYFAGGLDSNLDPGTLKAVNRTNAEALFTRLATTPPTPPPALPAPARLRHAVQHTAARLVFKLLQPGTD